MSWDVAIVRIRGKFRPILEVEEEDYLPLGGLKGVRAAVRAAFPFVEWSNPTWAVYLGISRSSFNSAASNPIVQLFCTSTALAIRFRLCSS